jgi:hypothetical protein
MPEPNPTAAAVAAQVSEVTAFEASLHGHDRETWSAYRALAAADTALASVADTRLAEIAALAADETKPAEYRRTETARMREAAIAEASALRGAATLAGARLEGRLRAQLVPAPDPIPTNRAMAREELKLTIDAAGSRMDALQQVLLTSRPAVVAELASEYGRLLLGPEASKLLDATMIGTLRRRGGHDDTSARAVHALAEFERRNLKGRSDGLHQIALSKLTSGRT